ncbi:MAG: class I SAM-dependent RNA methyltransferase, partial [Anaerolineae bacterium]|nr:class I SAM-dependent RNA methyltransferase [Anaerolineae bacterium]
DLLVLLNQLDMDISGLKKMRLQRGSDGAHMMILSVDSEDDIPDLLTDMATSVNLLLPDNQPINLIGETHSRYTIGEHSFRVTAGSEFRANISQLETLANVVLKLLALTGKETVLDLYGGVGFFSAFIAPHAGLVTLVESYPPAVNDADENLADFEHVDLIEGTVEEVTGELQIGYQAAVVDPGSEGLSIEVVDALAILKIPRLVYVSSDPATLARDCQRLTAQGYQLTQIQPIDLAPQTYFIDSIALLTI